MKLILNRVPHGVHLLSRHVGPPAPAPEVLSAANSSRLFTFSLICIKRMLFAEKSKLIIKINILDTFRRANYNFLLFCFILYQDIIKNKQKNQTYRAEKNKPTAALNFVCPNISLFKFTSWLHWFCFPDQHFKNAL